MNGIFLRHYGAMVPYNLASSTGGFPCTCAAITNAYAYAYATNLRKNRTDVAFVFAHARTSRAWRA